MEWDIRDSCRIRIDMEIITMASIFKRKDTGKWYVQWNYKGKLYRELIGRSKEAAQMRLAEIVRKIETGQFTLYSDAPLESFIKSFKKSLNAEPYSDSYKRRLENIFNNFEKYFKREKIERLKDIDFPVLDNYIISRINDDDISPKTANMEIDMLRRMFDYAVKHRYMLENPAKDLKRKKITSKEPKYFSQAEIDLLLEKAGKYEPFFMVLLHTGLRASDAGNLRWSNIDLEKGLIRLRQEKTSKGLTIPLSNTLRGYLLDYGTETPLLFPDLITDNKRQKVRMHIQKILREGGYEWKKIGCHAFRHTFASHMVIRGASIYDVKELLGHKSIYMTQMYAHLSESATRRSVDLIDFNPNSGINPVLITGGHQRKGA